MPSGVILGVASDPLDAGLDEGGDLGVDRRQLATVAGGDEAGAKPRQRVAGGVTLGLAGKHVVAGVVGSVAAEAHGVRLDQDGAGGGADLGDGGGESAGAGLDIGRVEREALHAVAGGAAPELGAGRELFADRRGVGVAVVLDDEDDGQREQRGEVERLVDVAGARGAVAEERKPDGGPAEAALGVRGARHIGEHRAEMRNHRQGAVRRIAVVDVALAAVGGAGGVGEVLVQVVAEVVAPDQVAAKPAVGKRDHINGLVGEQRERDDQAFAALTAGHRALDQPLTEEVKDAVVPEPGELHPGVDAQPGLRG